MRKDNGPYYHSPYMLEALDILNTEVIFKVYHEGLSPKDALDQAADKLRDLMK